MEEVFWGKIDFKFNFLTMLTLVHIKRQIQALERSRDVIALNWWSVLVKKCSAYRIRSRRAFSHMVMYLGNEETTHERKTVEINRALRYLHIVRM